MQKTTIMRPLLGLFLLYPSLSLAASFRNPSIRVSWEVGSNQTLEWTSEWPEYTVALWQSIGPGNVQTTNRALVYQTPVGGVTTGANSVDWTVQLYDFDLVTADTFFFWLCKGRNSHHCVAGEDPGQVSPDINFFAANNDEETSTSTTATSTSSPSSSPTNTATSTTSISPLPTTTSTSDPAADNDASSQNSDQEDAGLSTGATAGVAVACTVVGLAALAALFLWWRHLRKKDAAAAAASTAAGNNSDNSNGSGGQLAADGSNVSEYKSPPSYYAGSGVGGGWAQPPSELSSSTMSPRSEMMAYHHQQQHGTVEMEQPPTVAELGHTGAATTQAPVDLYAGCR